jgi:Arc/MetJ family transcription regulator
MPTNLNIDDSLIEKAVILGKHKSKREAVNTALEEYVKLRKQMRIKELFNSIDYDKSYNHKRQRSRK